MKKIAIISLVISMVSLAMVAFLYMPNFKKSPSLDSLDVYQRKIVELFPELENAVYIDSAQYYSFNLSLMPTYVYSILNNTSIVGFYDEKWTKLGKRRYEYFNSQNKMCYSISFGKLDPQRRLQKQMFTESEDVELSEISTFRCDKLHISKKIVEKDTLVQLSYDDNENKHRRFYSLKKEKGYAKKLVEYDWNLNSDEQSLNTIKIASKYPEHFTLNIVAEYNDKLKLRRPVFEGKTTELVVNYNDQEYRTAAIVTEDSNISEKCLDQQRSEDFIRMSCKFTLIAPFESCNLKIGVWYDRGFKASIFPIIDIKNDIQELMQCLNIW